MKMCRHMPCAAWYAALCRVKWRKSCAGLGFRVRARARARARVRVRVRVKGLDF